MMVITDIQMKALEAAAEENLAYRIGVFLDKNCDFSNPHDGSPVPLPDERRQLIRKFIRRARVYGISSERGFVQFVILGLGYSRCFDEVPKVQEMLGDPRHAPEENLQRVLNAVVVAEARSDRVF